MLAWFEQRWEYRLLKAVDNKICIPGAKNWLLNLMERAISIFYQKAKCQTKVTGTENIAAQETVVDRMATVQVNTINI